MVILSAIIMPTLYQRGNVLGVFLQPQRLIQLRALARPLESLVMFFGLIPGSLVVCRGGNEVPGSS